MEPWIPLFQTGGWISLIVWLVIRYGNELRGLIDSVHGRISKGSSIKAGPFEIGSALRPQTTAEQTEQLKLERTEAQPSESPAADDEINLVGKSIPLIAEDLVLRMLQEEYGSLINRQVSAGSDLSFDGFFLAGNCPHAIEIKYFSGHLPVGQMVDRVKHIHRSVRMLGWQRFQLIFVLVFDDNYPPPPERVEQLLEKLEKLDSDTIVRTFPFSDVIGHFGIDLFEQPGG